MKASLLVGLALVASAPLFVACVGDEPGVITDGSDSGGGGSGGEGGAGGEGGTVDEGGKVVNGPPTHEAQAIAFVDVDLAATIGGFVRIKRAADESDVSEYVVYAADAGGTKIGTPFRKASATGSDLSIAIDDGSTIPAGATQLLVVTSNAIGEMSTGKLTRFADAAKKNVAVSDSSSPITRAVGTPSKVVFDEAHRKVIVVTGDLSAFQCDLDGTGCIRHDISDGTTIPLAGIDAIVDAKNGRLLVTGAHADSGTQLPLWVVPLDFSSGAVFHDIGGGAAHADIGRPSLAIDAAGGKLHTVTWDSNSRSRDFVCNLDGTGCATGVEIFTTGSYGANPSAVYDPVGKSLVVATNDNAAAASLYRLYCPDGQACVQVKNTGIAGSSPRALLGPSGNLLLVATESSTSQASLVPCPLTSTGSCSAVAGLTAGSSIDAKAQSIDAAVDPASKKVVVATIGPATSGLDSNPHALGRCSADGASCTFVDFASTVTGANGSVTVDPESGQIFALSQGTSAGSTPTLFFLE